MIHTKWGKLIPACKVGRHKWKDSSESGVCSKCGFDVFDGTYKKVEL